MTKNDTPRRLAIGEVAERARMSASRIRYYEARGLLPEPERAAGRRRYGAEVLRRLAIIDAAQRAGFTLQEIRDLLGSAGEPGPERLRELAVMKLPELDDLIARAMSVRDVLQSCAECDCESIDVCRLFEDRFAFPQAPAAQTAATPLAPGGSGVLTSTSVEVRQFAGRSQAPVRRLSR